MAANNVVIFTGRIATKQLQLAQATIPILKFSLAVDRQLSKAKKNDPNVKSVDFFQITAFNNEANILVQYGKPGSWIQVLGRASTDEWVEEQSGQKRNKTEFILDSFNFLNTGGNTQNGQQQPASVPQYAPASQQQPQQQFQQPQQPSQPAPMEFYPIGDDDDLPF